MDGQIEWDDRRRRLDRAHDFMFKKYNNKKSSPSLYLT